MAFLQERYDKYSFKKNIPKKISTVSHQSLTFGICGLLTGLIIGASVAYSSKNTNKTSYTLAVVAANTKRGIDVCKNNSKKH
jgi:hypothetical protein